MSQRLIILTLLLYTTTALYTGPEEHTRGLPINTHESHRRLQAEVHAALEQFAKHHRVKVHHIDSTQDFSTFAYTHGSASSKSKVFQPPPRPTVGHELVHLIQQYLSTISEDNH